MSKEFWTPQELEKYFREVFDDCIELMLAKNSDYGGSWENDRSTTITDMIRHKVDRIVRLEEKQQRGEVPAISEGIPSELRDVINYCCFRMIKFDDDVNNQP